LTHPALSEMPAGDVIATDMGGAVKVERALRPPQTKHAVPNAQKSMVVTWLVGVFLFLL